MLRICFCLASGFGFAFLVVIPEGNLLLVFAFVLHSRRKFASRLKHQSYPARVSVVLRSSIISSNLFKPLSPQCCRQPPRGYLSGSSPHSMRIAFNRWSWIG